MTSTTIIEGALKILEESYLNSPNGTGAFDIGDLAGRSVSPHWSFYFLAAGAVAATIVIVVGAILHTHYFILGGIFFLISNGIGAYYNYEFKDLLQLSRLVQMLAKRVSEIGQDIFTLSKENADLKKNVDDLNKNLADLDKEREELNSETDALSENEQKLANTVKQAEQFRSLADRSEADNKQLQTELDELKQKTQTLGDVVKDVKAQLQKKGEESESLMSELAKFKSPVETYTKEKQSLVDLTRQLEIDIQTSGDKPTKETQKFEMDLNRVESEEGEAEKMAANIVEGLDILKNKKEIKKQS